MEIHKYGKIDTLELIIYLRKSNINNLNKDSVCDIFYIRNISTKRLKGKIGIIENSYLKEIDKKLLKMFDIKKDEI